MKRFIVLRILSYLLFFVGIILIVFSVFFSFTSLNANSTTGEILTMIAMFGGGVFFATMFELIKVILKIFDKINI